MRIILEGMQLVWNKGYRQIEFEYDNTFLVDKSIYSYFMEL